MSRPGDEYPKDERKYPDGEPAQAPPGSDDIQTERALNDLSQGRWTAAEQLFTATLTQGAGRSRLRALSVVGVAQARLFGAGDARGAFAMLQGLLGQEAGLPTGERARLHVVAAFLFSSAEVGLYDRERAARHADFASRLLANEHDDELAALAAVAELLVQALSADAARFLLLLSTRQAVLDAALEPVTCCLRLEVLAVAALSRGEREESSRLLGLALERARSLGFGGCEARLLLRIPRSTLDACAPDELQGVENSAPPLQTGTAPALGAELTAQILRLAPSRVSVLLVDGTDALRLTVARALHDASGRARGPFLHVDCTATTSDEAELALFGGPEYARARDGAVHLAETGTLYVAAIDELPILVQPRFLRFLDREKLVRVVASARVNLLSRVEQGHFRRDLGERLTLVQLVLPAARASV